MLRTGVSTDVDQCRVMLRLLRSVAGSGRSGAMKDVCSRGTNSSQTWTTKDKQTINVRSTPPSICNSSSAKHKLGTALGSKMSEFAEDFRRVEEYRTFISHRIHSFCKDTFASSGTKLRHAQGTGSSSILPYSVRGVNTHAALLARQRSVQDEDSKRNLTRQEDPFDSITDKIPERPVSVAEGASYSVVILLGLAVAGAAAYAVFKELVFEPKEYKVFGKALNRVQNDNQVTVRLGSPVTGYGQESRNRAARQRISNRAWTDEAGIERVEVMFHIRGPAGAGKVYSEMFKDPQDKTWKYTYLIVDVTSPSPTRLMLESYVPPLVSLNSL